VARASSRRSREARGDARGSSSPSASAQTKNVAVDARERERFLSIARPIDCSRARIERRFFDDAVRALDPRRARGIE